MFMTICTKALGADKLWQFMTDLGLMILDLPSLRGSNEETLDNASRSVDSATPHNEQILHNTSQSADSATPANASRRGLKNASRRDFGYHPKPTRLELEGAC